MSISLPVKKYVTYIMKYVTKNRFSLGSFHLLSFCLLSFHLLRTSLCFAYSTYNYIITIG